MDEKKKNENNPKVSINEMQKQISQKFLKRPGVLAVGTARVGNEMKLQVFVDNIHSSVVEEIQKFAHPHELDILLKSERPYL